MKKLLTFLTLFLMLGGNASTEEKILKCLSDCKSNNYEDCYKEKISTNFAKNWSKKEVENFFIEKIMLTPEDNLILYNTTNKIFSKNNQYYIYITAFQKNLQIIGLDRVNLKLVSKLLTGLVIKDDVIYAPEYLLTNQKIDEKKLSNFLDGLFLEYNNTKDMRDGYVNYCTIGEIKKKQI